MICSSVNLLFLMSAILLNGGPVATSDWYGLGGAGQASGASKSKRAPGFPEVPSTRSSREIQKDLPTMPRHSLARCNLARGVLAG